MLRIHIQAVYYYIVIVRTLTQSTMGIPSEPQWARREVGHTRIATQQLRKPKLTNKRIVNINKVYIERNNLQVELIRCCKKCLLYSRLRSNGFNAISPTERISGSFEQKPLRLRF